MSCAGAFGASQAKPLVVSRRAPAAHQLSATHSYPGALSTMCMLYECRDTGDVFSALHSTWHMARRSTAWHSHGERPVDIVGVKGQAGNCKCSVVNPPGCAEPRDRHGK